MEFKRDAFQRELRGAVLALLLTAAAAIIAVILLEYVGIQDGSIIFLIPALIAAWRFGLIPALAAAVTGVLWAGYLFYAPHYSLYVSGPLEFLNLMLFLVVAAVVSQLANLMKRQTEFALAREREMTELYAFSKRLAAATTAEHIYIAIQDHLANLVQRKVVLFGTGPNSIDGPHDRDAVPQRVRAEITRVQQDPGREATVDDDNGDVWLVRRVSPATPDFGVVAVELGAVSGAEVAEVSHRIASALSDAAATAMIMWSSPSEWPSCSHG